MIVLSLFDGISSGYEALRRAGIPVTKYFASEIDKYAITASKNAYDGITYVGDVTKVTIESLGCVPDLIIGGSPCQGFSLAGRRLNFEDPRSKLFFDFVRLLNEARKLNPDVLFMLENVIMKRWEKDTISEYLGVEPVEIDGGLVSAQGRRRYFWSNIKTKKHGFFGGEYTDIPQPKDLGIGLTDILDEVVDSKYLLSKEAIARIERHSYSKAKVNPIKTGTINTKNNSGQLSVDSGTTLVGVVNDRGSLRQVTQSTCIDSNYMKGMDNHGQRTLAVVVHNMMGRTSKNGNGGSGHLTRPGKKAYRVDASKVQAVEFLTNNPSGYSKHQQYRVNTGKKSRSIPAQDNARFTNTLVHGTIRRLTPEEVCRLFTLPSNFFKDKDGKNVISESQQYKCLGNGWIVDVVAHIFSFIDKKYYEKYLQLDCQAD